MKISFVPLALVTVLLLQGCGETPTAPVADEFSVFEEAAAFSRTSGGTTSPKFNLSGTSCYYSTLGEVYCPFKMTGLGKSAEVNLAVVGMMVVSHDCIDPGGVGTTVTNAETVRVFFDYTTKTDRNGNVSGVLVTGEPTAVGSGDRFTLTYYECMVQTGTRTVFGVRIPVFQKWTPANIRFRLNDRGVGNRDPQGPGVWAFFAETKTGKNQDSTYHFFMEAISHPVYEDG